MYKGNRSKYIGLSYEVTKREVMFSVVIVLLMIVLGFYLEGKISNGVLEQNEIYYKAVKINNNKDQFEYGMKSNIGNALVYGDMKAVDSVSMPELTGEYMAITKTKERYTRHTRIVTTTDSNGKTKTRTETYYTWDTIGADKVKSKEVDFLGSRFKIGIFKINAYKILKLNEETVNEQYRGKISGSYLYDGLFKVFPIEGDIRYSFSVIDEEFMCSIIVNLKDNTIYNIDSLGESISVFHNVEIHQLINKLEDKEKTVTVMFWILWVAVIIVVVIFFVKIENEWLED